MDGIPNFPNPYSGIETSEIHCAIDAIDRIKEQMDAMVADVAAQHIHGIDVGEFSSYMDDAFGDTLGASKSLAENILEDRGAGRTE